MVIWRRNTPISIERPQIPQDVGPYLEARENAVPGIRTGLEKRIAWADPVTRAKTGFSVIYLHGFSASSEELRPVPDRIAGHLGANLFFTRLAGHAIDGEALGRATLPEWLADVAEAFAIGGQIGERVVVMATSTGAALATWALSQPQFSSQVAAAVFFSPNYKLLARGASLLASPLAPQLIRMILGPTRSFAPTSARHAHAWTCSYSTRALLPLAQAMQLANQVPVEEIAVPTLFLLARRDQVVDARRTEEVARRWGAAHQIIAIENGDDPSGHVLAGDILSPSTNDDVVDSVCAWLDGALRSPQSDVT